MSDRTTASGPIGSTLRRLSPLALALGLLGCAAVQAQQATRPAHTTTVPGDPGPSPTLGARPPAMSTGTVVLFDGSDWSGWRQRDGSASGWTVEPDGIIRAGGGDAVSAPTFGDHQLHIEFLCPEMPGHQGQARSNSGVYVQGRYEVQVLDTFGNDPAMNGCGAVYAIAPPRVNAARPAGTWQTYDIVFRAARLDPEDHDQVLEPARITVIHNGIMVHNNLVLPNVTPGGLDDRVPSSGPLLLQDHGDPVRYRNIWIVE